jgi:hypothetical protein
MDSVMLAAANTVTVPAANPDEAASVTAKTANNATFLNNFITSASYCNYVS